MKLSNTISNNNINIVVFIESIPFIFESTVIML